MEIRIDLVELHRIGGAPALAAESQMRFPGFFRPGAIELKARLRQHRRFQGAAKGIAFRLGLLGMDGGGKGPAIAFLAFDKAELRHLAQNLHDNRQPGIEAADKFLLRHFIRKRAGVARMGDGDKKLFGFLILDPQGPSSAMSLIGSTRTNPRLVRDSTVPCASRSLRAPRTGVRETPNFWQNSCSTRWWPGPAPCSFS